MTNSSQPEEAAGDYSYDLVHEDVQPTHGGPGRTAPSASASMPTPRRAESDGDYSYDMAHDLSTEDP